MPGCVEACCETGRAECTQDLKELCGVHQPSIGKVVPLFSEICDRDAEKAKDKLITVAMCNCQCALFWSTVMFLMYVLTVKNPNIGVAIINFLWSLVSPILLIWGLRCCFHLQSKCWWTVYTVLQWINLVYLIYGSLSTLSFGFNTNVIFIWFYLVGVTLLTVYSTHYCLGNKWPEADSQTGSV